MWREPHSRAASRLRQRKFALIDHLPALADQLSGTLTRSYTRCGKPTCRCARGEGHPAWSLTYMLHGERHVDRIPAEWAEEVQRRVRAGREFQDAVQIGRAHV